MKENELNNKEIWKPAKYYRSKSGIVEDLSDIEVSNLGDFRYTNTKNKINVSKPAKGYPVVNFYRDKKQLRFSAHVVLASTFLKTPTKSGYVVDQEI